MAFVQAAKVSDIPAGAIKDVKVGEMEVALANVGGKFYAISNTCLHRGGPLGQGVLEDRIVTCPWHGWLFDVTTGMVAQNDSVGVSCFATEVRGEEVYVNLSQPCS